MRYENVIGNDTVMAPDGDPLFMGVDERRDPRQLEAGLVARATNIDFEQGIAASRRGMQTVGWACELSVCFPLCFRDQDFDFEELFSASYLTCLGKNFRVNHGTTLEIYSPVDEKWYAIWVTLSGGIPVLTVSATGTATIEGWDYQAFDAGSANFRIFENYTLQLFCPDDGLFYTIYVSGLTVAVAAVGGDPVDQTDSNWVIEAGSTLSLVDPSTSLFHSLFIEMGSGSPQLSISTAGTPEQGFCFDEQTGFGDVKGVAVFSDPFGQEGALVAIERWVYRIMPNQRPQIIRLPENETIPGRCRMVQAFDRVMLFRGPDLAPLVWIPRQDFTNGLGSFTAITQSSARGSDADNTYGDGTEPIPAADEAVLHNNRIFVIQGRDELVVSDILDYTRYSEATQRFKINQGEDDQLMRVLPYNQTTLILFKTQSVYSMSEVFGDLSTVRSDVISHEYGLVGRDAVVAVGKDILFLSEMGVFALSQALDNKLQAGNEPISAPITPIIQRINWAYATGAQMAYHENRLYLAVPLDGARYNNAVLVYNFLNRAWSGTWTGPLVDVRYFFRLNYAGRRAAWFITGTSLDDTNFEGAAVLLNRDTADYAFGTWTAIDTDLVTRGYPVGTIEQKDYRKLLMDMSWLAGDFTVQAIRDGVNEVSAEVQETPDRTKYLVWGKGLYDETNVTGTHADPYREDYSVNMSAFDSLYLRADGVGLERSQRRQIPMGARSRGGYVQVRIRNSRGRHAVHAVMVEAKTGKRSMQRYG